jgi:hypothetical protein
MLNIDHRTTPTAIKLTMAVYRAQNLIATGGTMSSTALNHATPSKHVWNRRTGPEEVRTPQSAGSAAVEDASAAEQRQGTWCGLLGLLTLGLALAAAAGTLGARTWQVGTGLGSALFPVEDIVELAAVAVGTVVAGRVGLHALVALACVLADRRGRRWAAGERAVARHAPAFVRRLARAAAGAGLGLALATPTAMALPNTLGVPVAANAGPPVVLDLRWQPTDRDTTDQRPSRERASLVNRSQRTGMQREPLVVVEPGDTLWAIAADQLATDLPADQPAAERRGKEQRTSAQRTTGSGARGSHGGTEAPSDAEIAAAVTQWHNTNRQVLGQNPDLIRPGTVLRLP